MTTLSGRLQHTSNALNLIRLVLAVLVIVSHASPIGGFGPDPAFGDLSVGSLAVGGFFAISGYLITLSRYRTSLMPFVWRRALRILPGFWACLIFTAFAAAAVAGYFRGGWSIRSACDFLFTNFLLLQAGSGSIGATLAGAYFPHAWNGSLWTLRYEVLCYLAIGGGLVLPYVRKSKLLFVAGYVLSTLVSVIVHAFGVTGAVADLALLVPFFMAGAVIFRYSDRIACSGGMASCAAVAVLACCVFSVGRSLAALPIAYLMFYVAATLPEAFKQIGSKTDISYGMYLYAFPVQQLLVVAGAEKWGLALYTAACIAATVPLAILSFFIVERPSLKLKNIWSKQAARAQDS